MRYHRFVARLFGIRIRVIGTPVTGEGVLMVANHTSWLDIVIFSAVTPLSFVAKAEVATWPFFGTLARLQRTVFVDRAPAQRNRRGARRHPRTAAGRRYAGAVSRRHLRRRQHGAAVQERAAGRGGSGPGQTAGMCTVQPVSTAYVGAHGIPMGRENRPLFAWYGDMELVPHLWEALKAGPAGCGGAIPSAPAAWTHGPQSRTGEKAGARKVAGARPGQARAASGQASPCWQKACDFATAFDRPDNPRQ